LSDVSNVNVSAKDFRSSPESAEYSKVILHIDEENYVEAGNDTGRTLEANCPFATQEIAENLLEKLKGFQYQPYSAGGAIFDPAAELGDGVTVGDIVGGLYGQDINLDSLFTSNIEAPQDGDIEHEYPYEPKQDREINRRISKRVTQSQAESLINQEMDKITLSVSGEGGATTFEIKKDNATISSETVDLKVKSVNIEGELSASKITSGELNANNVKVISSGDVGGGYGDCSMEFDGQFIKGTHDNSGNLTVQIGSQVDTSGDITYVHGDMKMHSVRNYQGQTTFKRIIWLGGEKGASGLVIDSPDDSGKIALVYNPDVGMIISMDDYDGNHIFSLAEDGDGGTLRMSNGTIRCKRLIVNGHEIT